MLHSSRAILALNGTLMVILGGLFWVFPEFFTMSMFPDIAENQDAIDVGVALRKNMGAGCAFIGIILFSCQSSSKSDSTTIIVFLSDWFPLDDRGTHACETVRTGRRSIVHCSFLFNLMYFVIVCGIAAFSRINFYLLFSNCLYGKGFGLRVVSLPNNCLKLSAKFSNCCHSGYLHLSCPKYVTHVSCDSENNCDIS